MTEVAEPSSPAVRPARAPRRAPADMPFSFINQALVEAISDGGSDPAWLRADRLSALAAFEALPVESNRLYTPYVDLRAASLEGALPFTAPVTAWLSRHCGEDVAGLIELGEEGVKARSLDNRAAAAGVRLLTLPELVATDQQLARSLIEDAPLLPPNEKLAELSRAAWTTGVVVHVPAGVRVDRPIVVRWSWAPRGPSSGARSWCSRMAPRRPSWRSWSRATPSSPGRRRCCPPRPRSGSAPMPGLR